MDEQEPQRTQLSGNPMDLVRKETQGIMKRFWNCFGIWGEVTLDSFIESDFFRRIPLVSQVQAIFGIMLGIRDIIFANKVANFLDGMNSDQLEKLKEKLRADEEYKLKFAQKVVLMLDRMSDIEKAQILAKIVSAYAEDQIEKAVMERLFDAIDRVFIQDLQVLTAFYNCTDQPNDFIDNNFDSLQNLAMSGLVALNPQDGSRWAYQGDRFNPNRSGVTLVTILQGRIPPQREFTRFGKVGR